MSEYRKRTKADVRKTSPYTTDKKTKSGKVAKLGTRVEFNDDTETVLLNPYGKADKYWYELRKGIRTTNEGTHKEGRDGKDIKLTEGQRAYRSGYIDSQNDNAKAYKAKKAKRAAARRN
ncbi:MAG: hypothetical protein LUI60_02100 [Clostridia bacterium]|nr:hypothetical protein [Clostridia bacterium]